MNNRFEANNIDEVKEAVEHFNDFHDDYVAEIEIKFENYKALDNEGASTGTQVLIKQWSLLSTHTLIKKNMNSMFKSNSKMSFHLKSCLPRRILVQLGEHLTHTYGMHQMGIISDGNFNSFVGIRYLL